MCGDGYITNVGIIQHLDFYLLGKRWEHLNEADLLIPLRLGGVALHRCLPLGRRRCETHTAPARPIDRVRIASGPPWGWLNPCSACRWCWAGGQVPVPSPRSQLLLSALHQRVSSKALAVLCTAKRNTGHKLAAPTDPGMSQSPLGEPSAHLVAQEHLAGSVSSHLNGHHKTTNLSYLLAK